MTPLKLKITKEKFAICKLNSMEHISDLFEKGNFISITKTEEEISLICREEDTPHLTGMKVENDWQYIMIEGPLDISMVGVIAGFSEIFKNKGIPIFVLSTYNTDYIFIKQRHISDAIRALKEANHEVHEE